MGLGVNGQYARRARCVYGAVALLVAVFLMVLTVGVQPQRTWAAQPPKPTLEQTVDLGSDNTYQYVSVTDDGAYATAYNVSTADFTVIDLKKGKVTKRVKPKESTDFALSNDAAFYEDAKGGMTQLTLSNNKEKRLKGTEDMHVIAIDDDGTRLLLSKAVASSPDNRQIVVYDVKGEKVLSTVYEGKKLNQNASLSPDGKKAYVVSQSGDSFELTVVDAASGKKGSATKIADSASSYSYVSLITSHDGAYVHVFLADLTKATSSASKDLLYSVKDKSVTETGATNPASPSADPSEPLVLPLANTADETKSVGLREKDADAAKHSDLSNYELYVKDETTGKDISTVEPPLAVFISSMLDPSLGHGTTVSADGTTLYTMATKDALDAKSFDDFVQNADPTKTTDVAALLATDLKSGKTEQVDLKDVGKIKATGYAKSAPRLVLLSQQDGGAFELRVFDTHVGAEPAASKGDGAKKGEAAGVVGGFSGAVAPKLPIIIGGVVAVVVVVVAIAVIVNVRKRGAKKAPAVSGASGAFAGSSAGAGASGTQGSVAPWVDPAAAQAENAAEAAAHEAAPVVPSGSAGNGSAVPQWPGTSAGNDAVTQPAQPDQSARSAAAEATPADAAPRSAMPAMAPGVPVMPVAAPQAPAHAADASAFAGADGASDAAQAAVPPVGTVAAPTVAQEPAVSTSAEPVAASSAAQESAAPTAEAAMAPAPKKTPKFCGNCGAPLPPGSKFCVVCGHHVQ